MHLKGQTALVTGASSGIGEHFARQLAERGANLIITARRLDRLQKLATELEKAHGVKVEVIALDLGKPGAVAKLFAETEGAGKTVDILINNAGFGTQDVFHEIPWDKVAEQLQLNIVALTEATHTFMKPMLARKRGWVMNIASIGAYMPVPQYATYAAGKAYVRNFTEALAYELRNSPVRVCCLCPGGTETEFMQVAGHEMKSWMKLGFMSADECARIGLDALFAGRRNIVAGLMNKLMVLWLRFLPRRMIVWMASLVMAKEGAPVAALPEKASHGK